MSAKNLLDLGIKFMKHTSMALAFFAAVGFSAPANAQASLVNVAEISAACSGTAASCQAVVARQIASLRARGLTQAQINAQVAVIAAAVVSASATVATPAARAAVASALSSVAAASSNAQQRASIVAAATSVATGTTPPGQAAATTPQSFSAT